MAERKNKKRGMTKVRVASIGFGLLLVIAGPVLLYIERESHAGWATMIAGLIFMVVSRIEDIQEIGFGSFKTKLERRVEKVEDAMGAVRHLAKESARHALNSIQFAGRMGGFSETEKMQFLRDTRRLLSDLGIKDDEIFEAEKEWNKAVEFDYAHWALGLDQLPRDIPEPLMPKWNELRDGGVAGRSTSEEIRAFFMEAGILTPDRAEILQDYEHFEATRQHRREDVWLRRTERK